MQRIIVKYFISACRSGQTGSQCDDCVFGKYGNDCNKGKKDMKKEFWIEVLFYHLIYSK